MKNEKYIKNMEYLNSIIHSLVNSEEYVTGSKIKKIKTRGLLGGFISFIKNKKAKKLQKHVKRKVYCNNIDCISDKRIVIYTCMTGNYDNICSPLASFDNVDYVAFVDENSKFDGWNTITIPSNIRAKYSNSIDLNRYYKMNPYEVFAEKYEYSIYVDSNFLIVGDLREYIRNVNPKTGIALFNHRDRSSIYSEIDFCKLYKKGNKKELLNLKKFLNNISFPDDFGLYECGLIVADLSNPKGKEILFEWWKLFLNKRVYRDQVLLPIVIWKMKLKFMDIGIIGNNIMKDSKFLINSHFGKGR